MEKKVKAIPAGFHSVTPSLVFRGAKEAIEFYKKVFDAKVTFQQERPDGKIMHATITIGDSILMLADECPPHEGHKEHCVMSPADLGGTSVSMYLYVEDVDKVFNKAVANGATVSMAVEDMFWGDRMGVIKDPFGHFWAIATHTKEPTEEEMQKGMKELFSEEK
ncbi:MAG: VOC family protein [Gammaproteobacteria bacterium]|nr:VOC family protein [Gammaproteobacteria bacterium]